MKEGKKNKEPNEKNVFWKYYAVYIRTWYLTIPEIFFSLFKTLQTGSILKINAGFMVLLTFFDCFLANGKYRRKKYEIRMDLYRIRFLLSDANNQIILRRR